MAKEKQQPEPEVLVLEAELVQPQLSAQTLAEMEYGRRQAQANAAAFAAAEAARVEEAANK